MLRIVKGVTAGLAAVSLAGCGRVESPAPDSKFVIVEKAVEQRERDSRSYAAVVKPRIESVQSFRVAGRIAARLVDVGDHVSRGQILAALEATDWALNAQTVHGQLTASIAQRDSAQADLARFAQLTREKLISSAEFERQQHAVAAAAAQVAALTAAARAADNKLAYVKLRADAEGVVTQVSAEPGQVVAGHDEWTAIVDATVRRFRPIVLTATAAVLAMIPLSRSDFFAPQAITSSSRRCTLRGSASSAP